MFKGTIETVYGLAIAAVIVAALIGFVLAGWLL